MNKYVGIVLFLLLIGCSSGIEKENNTSVTKMNEKIIEVDKAITIYPGCDTPDIHVGKYIVAACNIGATKASEYDLCNLESLFNCTEDRIGYDFQFGKTHHSQGGEWVSGTYQNGYDWSNQAVGGKSNMGSANKWGIEDSEKLTATYENQNLSDRKKMQGPCANNYHVPTHAEWADVIGIVGTGPIMLEKLMIPLSGVRFWNISQMKISQGGLGYYWTSSPSGDKAYSILAGGVLKYEEKRANGMSVRCFRNSD